MHSMALSHIRAPIEIIKTKNLKKFMKTGEKMVPYEKYPKFQKLSTLSGQEIITSWKKSS
jgi:hypothetical protein